MDSEPFPQAVIALLIASSAQIAAEAAQRMRAVLPRYQSIPVEKLVAQNRRTVEQIARMMDESNFPVARKYFENLTEARARAGIPVDEFLRATEVMMEVVAEHVEWAFAHDPAYCDRALRVLHAGTVYTWSIIGRSHLREVVEKTRLPRPEKT